MHDSNMFDNLGAEYPSSTRLIGQKQMDFYSNLTHLFIAGVPIRMPFEFPNVDTEAESVALLNLKILNLRGSLVQLRTLN